MSEFCDSVRLSGADLARVNLSGVRLLKANLSGADLRGADLIGTDLNNARLDGADLSGALFFTQEHLDAARGTDVKGLDKLKIKPCPYWWFRSAEASARGHSTTPDVRAR